MDHFYFLKSLSLLYFLFFIILFLVISFVVQPFQITGTSMYPSLKEGDLILIDKISLSMGGDINRGDIVAFIPPASGEELLIKRVAASPGDAWILKESSKDRRGLYSPEIKIKLEHDEFYMIGDNMEESIDSRSFGAIRREKMIGRAIFVLWPLQEIKFLHPQKFEVAD